MNASIGRMLAYVPAGMGSDPAAVPSLALTGTATIALSDLTLYCSTSAAAVAVDLHGILVSQVAAALPVSATVLQDGPAELLLLPDATGPTGGGVLPVTLTLATSPLWQLFAAFSRMYETRRRSLASGMAQVNVRAAVGSVLDWWGACLGVGRLAGEPDALYGARVAGMTLQPIVNGPAIEAMFLALGYTVVITDTGPGAFQAQVTYPVGASFTYTQAQIAAILQQVKAAGVQASIYFEEPVAETMSISDAVSVTSPGGFAVAGTSKAGQSTAA